MLNFPLAGCGGGIGSDRHGFVECHSTLGSSGARFDPGDSAADELVSKHDPQVSAVRQGRAEIWVGVRFSEMSLSATFWSIGGRA